MNNGRMKDVLVEGVFITDERTGMQTFSQLRVWADTGNKEIISKVEGVSFVSVFDWMPTKYSVSIDPRYDVEYVKREIEAAILCGEQK